MLKSLFGLCVLQTLVLILVASRILILEGELAALNTDRQGLPTANTAISGMQPRPAPQAVAVSSSVFPDETRLREIISEELAAQLGGIGVAGIPAESRPPPRDSGPNYDELRDSVNQSVDYYVSVGIISEQEMGRLQHDIARLNPEDRKVVMSKIVRAMNSGQLDGRF